MKIVFFGTPSFAADVLDGLVKAKLNIVAVVSKPDKAKGRSSKLVPTAVKEIAEHYNLPCYQPEKASTPEFLSTLAAYQPDLFVVVAYGEIIKQFLLDLPVKGAINVHGSILPKYRGAAPIQRAIIDGEKETGISIIYLVKKMDAGDILHISKTTILENETTGELMDRLSVIGTESLLEVVEQIKNNSVNRVIQDESKVTIAPKIELDECRIDWDKDALQIHNLIRGVNPNPGAWCMVKIGSEEKRLKLYTSEVMKNLDLAPHEILLNKKGMIIGCNKDAILLKEVQLEGKKRMLSSDLARGMNIHSFF